MKTMFITAMIATTVTSQAAAQEFHASVGGIIDESFDELGVVGRGGYDFTPNFGLEAELNYFSVGEDDLDVGDGTTVDVDADVFSYIAFAKAQAPVGERVTVFGRVGYGGVTLDVEADGFGSESETEDAFAYGVGAAFAVGPRGAVRADYTRIDLGEDLDSEGFLALSYTFRFGGVQR